MNNKDDLNRALALTESQVYQGVKALITATDGAFMQNSTASSQDFMKELNVIEAPIVLDGVEIEPPNSKKKALLDTQAAEEKQRVLRAQYESDRMFFEKNVVKKARGLCEIQEDYIKVLHPLYRAKFIDGIRRYGTVAAAMKWMKDNHSLVLRGDVLRRISLLIPSFKQEIDDAMDEYQATLHMEMYRRAVEGTDKGVWHQGELVGYEKQYSDSLLVKMVDTHNPEYKEAKASDKSRGGAINVTIIKDFHNYKDA